MSRTAKILAAATVVALGFAGCNQVDPEQGNKPAPQRIPKTDDGSPASQAAFEELAIERASGVTHLRVPNGGIQPQAVADAKGTLHLIYFKGDKADAGDLFYVRRDAGQERFSEPIGINSRPGTACAAGSVRGGQISLGKGGRLHVVWNGDGTDYARLNDSGTAFEEQRNLMQQTHHADGGGTVAADDAGNVYVVWHGHLKGEDGEGQRKVWVARSTDDGQTFSLEAPAWTEPTGACACCSTRAFADRRGVVYLLYRSATADVNRDIYLLASQEKGTSFQGALVHQWMVPG